MPDPAAETVGPDTTIFVEFIKKMGIILSDTKEKSHQKNVVGFSPGVNHANIL